MCRGVTEQDARGRMEMEADDPEKLERFFFPFTCKTMFGTQGKNFIRIRVK